jgi:hypothetical protein
MHSGLMEDVVPSMCAEHSVLCPCEGRMPRFYKERRKAKSRKRGGTQASARKQIDNGLMADVVPSMCAGHSVLCPYEGRMPRFTTKNVGKQSRGSAVVHERRRENK